MDREKTIYISGDGIYLNVCPDVLINGGEFLISKYNFINIFSTSSLMRGTNTLLIRNDKAVLVGVDYFGEKPADRSLISMPALPNSITEIEIIDDILKPLGIESELIKGVEASESKFKLIRRPKFLHVSSHSSYGTDTESIFSDFKIENYKPNTGLKTFYEVKSPIWKSKIYLSKYNDFLTRPSEDSFENGVISAYEIVGMDFTNTELVNLSACRSGRGGAFEGIVAYGLRRSFITAGARNVISSTENVSEKEVSEFNELFYRKWLREEKPISDAFYQAKIDMMEKYQFNPQYWGVYQLTSYYPD